VSALRIRSYYLDRPLAAEEVKFVSEALGAQIEQVQVPRLFPVPSSTRELADEVSGDAAAIASNLVKAGIRADGGTQVALVVPRDSHQYLVLCEAIHRATGFHPYLIQTAEQREHTGNAGDLRVLDSHGLRGMK
jgi:hypothetical protein